jgi:hypothetical protein
MIVTRPINISETNLLINKEAQPLIITDLEKYEIKRIPAPQDGWTHDKLESIDFNNFAPDGWEAFLGDLSTWIGGSEI